MVLFVGGNTDLYLNMAILWSRVEGQRGQYGKTMAIYPVLT